MFDTGETFHTKRLSFRKDRLKRLSSGRRTKTRSKDKGGRYVRSIFNAPDDVAIDATIRAAAPYQQVRKRQNMLVIHDRDLRYKQREKKTGHLVIFAVDGSGSMGAQRRMTEAKAAIQSLLMDCYQKRDKVAMIVFRKDKAETVLQPTSSVEHASRTLKEIPTGGKTPLSSGLVEAHALIKRYAKKAPETRFLPGHHIGRQGEPFAIGSIPKGRSYSNRPGFFRRPPPQISSLWTRRTRASSSGRTSPCRWPRNSTPATTP